jgi:hypothetical protein
LKEVISDAEKKKLVTNTPDVTTVDQLTLKINMHLLMRQQHFQQAVLSIHTEKSKQLRNELLHLSFVVHVYLTYERVYADHKAKILTDENDILTDEIKIMKPKVAIIPDNKWKREELHVVRVDNSNQLATIIRGQKRYAQHRLKKIMNLYGRPGSTQLLGDGIRNTSGCVTDHPNSVAKWSQLLQQMERDGQIKRMVDKSKGIRCIQCEDVDALIEHMYKSHQDDGAGIIVIVPDGATDGVTER